MTDPKKFMTFLGEMWADVEDYVSDNFEAYKKRLLELQTSAKNRDPDLWANAGADPTLTVDDFAEVPILERSSAWRSMLESMLSAARVQALFDTGFFADMITMSERHGEELNTQSTGLSEAGMRQVVKEFPGSKVTENARAARRS
jgi:hypothetical protein